MALMYPEIEDCSNILDLEIEDGSVVLARRRPQVFILVQFIALLLETLTEKTFQNN